MNRTYNLPTSSDDDDVYRELSSYKTNVPDSSPIVASLSELDGLAFQSGESGVIQSTVECLAVMRQFCQAALHQNLSASVWINGLALDSFVLDSTGQAWITSCKEVPWLPPEAAKKNNKQEKTVAYGLGVALLNILSEEPIDPVLYSVLEALCHDRAEQRPSLTTVESWCNELEAQVPQGNYCTVITNIFARLFAFQEETLNSPKPSRALLQDIRTFYKGRLRHVLPSDSSINQLQILFSDIDSMRQLQTVTGIRDIRPPPPPVRSLQKVPSAFTSHLTHFTPIVIAGDNQPKIKEDKTDIKHFIETEGTESKISFTQSGSTSSAKGTASRALAEKLRQIAKENRRICLADIEAEAAVTHLRHLLDNHQDLTVSSVGSSCFLPASSHNTQFYPQSTTSTTCRNVPQYRKIELHAGRAFSDPVAEHWLTRGTGHVHKPKSKDAHDDKDSGIVDKSFATPLERLLSADSLVFQKKLAEVIRALNTEFSLAGVSESQADLLLFAEYVVSLVNLRKSTFCSAVRERFPDLYWRDELLQNLFEIINQSYCATDNMSTVSKIPKKTLHWHRMDGPLYTATEPLQGRLAQLNQQLFLTQRDIQSLQRLGGNGEKEVNVLKSRLEFLESMRRQAEAAMAEDGGLPIELCISLSQTQDKLYLKTEKLEEFLIMRQGLVYSGNINALTAFLFCRNSISCGFIPEYLMGFRYFTTADYLLNFLLTILQLSLPVSHISNAVESLIMSRGLLLLEAWISDFYSIDFANNSALFSRVLTFVNSLSVQSEDFMSYFSSPLENLLALCDKCIKNQTTDLLYPTVCVQRVPTTPRPCSLYPWPLFKVFADSRITATEFLTVHEDDASKCGLDDNFSVFDNSEEVLATALCALAHRYFLAVHPVHFCNFESGAQSPLSQYLRFCSNITKWVQAEVIASGSSKNRSALSKRFWAVATVAADKGHQEVSCAMTEGLTAPRLLWAPGFSKLDSKAARQRKKLIKQRQQIAQDPVPARPANDVLPPGCLLEHLHRLEIGSFKLVNGDVKWYKVRETVQALQSVRLARQRCVPACAAPVTRSVSKRIERFANMNLDLLQSTP